MASKLERDMTTSEVAKVLRCSAETVRRLIDSGHLRAYTIPPTHTQRRVRHSVLAEYMRTYGYSTAEGKR